MARGASWDPGQGRKSVENEEDEEIMKKENVTNLETGLTGHGEGSQASLWCILAIISLNLSIFIC